MIIGILILSGAYGSWTFISGNQPFCSPDGGFYPCNYSATLTIYISYSGSWQAQYYGYHGTPYKIFSANGSFTGGNFSGVGTEAKSITLTGPDNEGLGMCVLAEKLDQSINNLTISIVNRSVSNSTDLPSGSTYICAGVYP
jgi:hypothetical protein